MTYCKFTNFCMQLMFEKFESTSSHSVTLKGQCHGTGTSDRENIMTIHNIRLWEKNGKLPLANDATGRAGAAILLDKKWRKDGERRKTSPSSLGCGRTTFV